MEYIEIDVERALSYPMLYVGFYGFDGKKLETVKRVNEFFSYHKAMGTKKVRLWKEKNDGKR